MLSIHPEREGAPTLVIQGHNMAELASALKAEIESAIALKDFSKLLSPYRRFEV